MTGRVQQVEEVGLAVLRLVVHRHRMRLDRNAALALQVHRVQRLLLELALRDGMRQFENAVRKRRLPMVDMGDDAEIADVLELHLVLLKPALDDGCLVSIQNSAPSSDLV